MTWYLWVHADYGDGDTGSPQGEGVGYGYTSGAGEYTLGSGFLASGVNTRAMCGIGTTPC